MFIAFFIANSHMKSSKRSIVIIATLLAVAQVTWAQTPVTTASELTTAVGTDNASIVLENDIVLGSYLNIDGKTITITLNGHTLSRNITGSYASDGHVIYVHNTATLTINGTGSIAGGKANNGGAIYIEPGSTVNATDVTFQNNSAGEHAGAIWNGGTLTATGCTFANNSAQDVGAVYNSVVQSSCGTAAFTSCTFTENTSATSGGAIANAQGNTSITLNNCTLNDNTAATNGGAVWNGGTLNINGGLFFDNTCGSSYNGGAIYHLYGTLNMSGRPIISGNTSGGAANNVYLPSGKVINAGAFTSGASIGISAANISATFTSGFASNNPSAAAGDFFSLDNAGYAPGISGGEVVATCTVTYRDLNGVDVQQSGCRILSGFTDGGTLPSGWYVVNSDISVSGRLNVTGTVNLILGDGTTLYFPDGGISVFENNNLIIWGQSASSGRLNATTPGDFHSAIGGVSYSPNSGNITINGGIITATSSSHAAAIGGAKDGSGHVTINGGTVTAACNNASGAGIGGGGCFSFQETNDFGNTTVTITGGTVTATGGSAGAGIGGGQQQKGTVNISGGTVTATGGSNGAGIGGGQRSNGIVTITGGTIVATGGSDANGIGHGNTPYVGSTSVSLSYVDNVSVTANSYGGTLTFQRPFEDTEHNFYAAGNHTSDEVAGKTLIPESKFTITVGSLENGSITASHTSAPRNATVTLTAVPDAGFEVSEITVTGNTTSDNIAVSVAGSNTYTFTMPAENVTVSAIFAMPVSYIDLDGAEQTVQALGVNGNTTTLTAGWWVLNEGTISNRLSVATGANVNLILRDGIATTLPMGIRVSSGSSLTIWGQSAGTGTLTGGSALNEDNGCHAGIGGNANYDSGTITINGGTINIDASNSIGAAGIGGGGTKNASQGNPYHGGIGTVIINGGTVTARGGEYGAGIGGGAYRGGDVTINDGTVTGYSLQGNGIGAGRGGSSHPGYVTINSGEVRGVATGGVNEGGNGIGGDYCEDVTINGGRVTATSNQYDGYGIVAKTVSINNATVTATKGSNSGDGIKGNSITLGYINYARIFAASYNGTVTLAKAFMDTYSNSYPAGKVSNNSTIDGKTLIPEQISLVDDIDNSQALEALNGQTRGILSISGRTLWKDGSWNTLCLPFALSSITGTPLEGATIKALTGASFTNGVLTLTFGDAVTAIEAGKPYIVKWASGENITSPVFNDVTISNTTSNTTVGNVTFTGTFSPVSLTANDKTKLYLGADNKLYYATTNLNINAFRGYFVLGGNASQSRVRSVVLNAEERPATDNIETEE